MRLGYFDGMRYPLLGLKHILAHRELWPYAIKSMIVGVILFVVLIAIAVAFLVGFPGDLFTDGFEVKTLFLGCLSLFAGIAGGIVLFALIGNVVAGPYLEAMTERMMADAGRLKETPTGYWMSFWAGIGNQLARFVLFVLVQFSFLGAYFTPAALFHPILVTLAAIFFVAIEHLEYPLEARAISFFDRIQWSLKRALPTMGFGTTLFFVMPVAGFVLLPAAVCGAVLLESDLEATESAASSAGS
jgi:uncharacterized protein involved in cysteine biosynthesis